MDIVVAPAVTSSEMAEEEEEGAAKTHGAGVASSVFNLANTILGSGMLAMSHVCEQSGWVTFALLLAFMGVLADRCASFIVESIKMVEEVDARSDAEDAAVREEEPKGCGTGRLRPAQRPVRVTSYQTLARRIFGTPGEIVASIAVVLQQIGACTVYVVAFADMLYPVISAIAGCGAATGFVGDVVCHRAYLQIVVIVVVIFPLCMLSKIDSLKYVSFVSLTLMIAYAVMVVFFSTWTLATNSGEDGTVAALSRLGFGSAHGESSCASSTPTPVNGVGAFHWLPAHLTALNGIPILSFAFLCHQNLFPIYAELRDPSTKRMALVARVSIGVCAAAYLITGTAGYYLFRDGTCSDLLSNFPSQAAALGGNATEFATVNAARVVPAILMDVVRSGYAFSVVLSYPLIIWEAREGVHELLMQAIIGCVKCRAAQSGANKNNPAGERLLQADGDGALRSVAGSGARSASMDAEAGSNGGSGGGGSSEAGHGNEGEVHGDVKCCIPNVLQRLLLNICIISLTAVMGIFGKNIGCVIQFVGCVASSLVQRPCLRPYLRMRFVRASFFAHSPAHPPIDTHALSLLC
jgi:amino acid permease